MTYQAPAAMGGSELKKILSASLTATTVVVNAHAACRREDGCEPNGEYVCVYIHTHICERIHVHIHIHKYIYIYNYIYTYKYIYKHTRTYIYIYRCLSLYTYVDKDIYI